MKQNRKEKRKPEKRLAVPTAFRYRSLGIALLCCIWLIGGGVLLSGCAPKETETQTEVAEGSKRYFLNSEATKIVGEAYELKSTTKEGQIEELLAALDMEPQTEGYQRAKPAELVIQSYSLASNEVLTLQFDTTYQQVTGIFEVLMRAAVVKTLCQVEGVTSVEFYVGGQPLMRANGKPVGMMKAEDFIDNTGANTEFYQNAYVSIYFANEAGDALVETNLKITYDGTISTEQLIISQLIAGPVEEGMRTAVPEGTVLNKVSVKDGVCYVDFNEKFMEKRSDVSEEVTIYSVVNSLAELSNIYKVQFTINGETKKTYQTLEFSGAFERNLEIVDGDQ